MSSRTAPRSASTASGASARQRPPARVHRAWGVALVSGLAIVAAAAFTAMPGLLMDPLHTEYRWSRASIGLAASVNMVVYGLVAPFAAAMMDRFGIRRIALAALAVIVLGSGLTTVVTAPWQLTLYWGLLITNVVIPQASMADVDTITDALVERGYDRSDRKYLYWYEADGCGLAWGNGGDDRPGEDNPHNAGPHYAALGTGCWTWQSSGHELLHTLGAVQSSAPNATEFGHCWDDGIESEGGNQNVRIWGNYLDRTAIGIATTVTSVGPAYVFRNVWNRAQMYARVTSLDADDRQPFFKSGSDATLGSGRRYIFHNTMLQAASGTSSQDSSEEALRSMSHSGCPCAGRLSAGGRPVKPRSGGAGRAHAAARPVLGGRPSFGIFSREAVRKRGRYDFWVGGRSDPGIGAEVTSDDAGPNKEVRREHSDRGFGEDHRARSSIRASEARHRGPARGEGAPRRDLCPHPGREPPCATSPQDGLNRNSHRHGEREERPHGPLTERGWLANPAAARRRVPWPASFRSRPIRP